MENYKKIQDENKKHIEKFENIKKNIINNYNKEHKEKIENNKKSIIKKYEKTKMNEVIGPFSFAKDLREAQKNYYKNIQNLNEK